MWRANINNKTNSFQIKMESKACDKRHKTELRSFNGRITTPNQLNWITRTPWPFQSRKNFKAKSKSRDEIDSLVNMPPLLSDQVRRMEIRRSSSGSSLASLLFITFSQSAWNCVQRVWTQFWEFCCDGLLTTMCTAYSARNGSKHNNAHQNPDSIDKSDFKYKRHNWDTSLNGCGE